MEIITNEDGTFVVPPITDAKGNLTPKEPAPWGAVTEHLSSVIVLLRKFYSMNCDVADLSEQSKFIIGLSALTPDVGAARHTSAGSTCRSA